MGKHFVNENESTFPDDLATGSLNHKFLCKCCSPGAKMLPGY